LLQITPETRRIQMLFKVATIDRLLFVIDRLHQHHEGFAQTLGTLSAPVKKIERHVAEIHFFNSQFNFSPSQDRFRGNISLNTTRL
jgi:AraC-like DNA-binding protein